MMGLVQEEEITKGVGEESEVQRRWSLLLMSWS